MWWMYSNEKKNRSKEFGKIWGRGFTIYGLLPQINRGIQNLDFEYCIIPIHHTNISNYQYIHNHISNILKKFDGKKIAVIDGWDRDYINPQILNLCLCNNIKYFKRELFQKIDGVYPITFAFPEEKIPNKTTNIENKIHNIAPLIPVNQSINSEYMKTYIYDTEQSYYQMYQNSYFALTSKKGGWDTLRHYEIIANGCIPIFVDLENCPQYCLWNFPKQICLDVKHIKGLRLNTTNKLWVTKKTLLHCGYVNIDNPGHIDFTSFDFEFYNKTLDQLKQWLYNIGTTKQLAKYVMDTINEN
jgi:hypothetical protein